MKKLAIVTTHPIQYYAPWFKLLATNDDVDLKVFYTWSQAKESVKDHNFGKEIKWDIPLLEGYNYEFVENKSKQPGSHHFFGIKCPDLINRVKSYDPDIILVVGWNFISHFKVMRYFKGKVPLWFRGDSTLLDEKPGYKTKLRRKILKFVYKYVDKALYVGQANKAYFIKHGLTEDQLVYVPHAIDNDRFGNSENKYDIEADNWRKKLGLSKADIVVLFAGKLEPKKQPDLLLNAFQKANKLRDQPLKLIFIGHGVLENKLIKLASNDKHVKILPFQNQSKMPSVYRLSDVFCLPSRGPGETWGLALNEAMASNIPVIASDKVGSAQDLIIHKENGFLFAHNQPEQLIEILQGLNKNQLSIMGEIAFKKISNWSYQVLVNNILKVLKKNIKA